MVVACLHRLCYENIKAWLRFNCSELLGILVSFNYVTLRTNERFSWTVALTNLWGVIYDRLLQGTSFIVKQIPPVIYKG